MVTSLIQGDERLEAISCKFFRKKDDLPLPVPVLSKLLSNSEGKLLSLKGALYIIGMLSKYASILVRILSIHSVVRRIFKPTQARFSPLSLPVFVGWVGPISRTAAGH